MVRTKSPRELPGRRNYRRHRVTDERHLKQRWWGNREHWAEDTVLFMELVQLARDHPAAWRRCPSSRLYGDWQSVATPDGRVGKRPEGFRCCCCYCKSTVWDCQTAATGVCRCWTAPRSPTWRSVGPPTFYAASRFVDAVASGVVISSSGMWAVPCPRLPRLRPPRQSYGLPGPRSGSQTLLRYNRNPSTAVVSFYGTAAVVTVVPETLTKLTQLHRVFDELCGTSFWGYFLAMFWFSHFYTMEILRDYYIPIYIIDILNK